jgi:hypothetical protein
VGALQIQTLAGQLEKLDESQDQQKALEIINDMLRKIQAVELFIHEKSATLLSAPKKIES